MLNTTLERVTQCRNLNSATTDEDERRVPQRNILAAKSGPDHALVELVRRALSAAGHPALRNIQIETERGIVILWGRVPTYHQKQLAQALAQQVDGVCGIANGIEVVCCR